MSGRLLVWTGTVWIIVAALFLDWAYAAGQPASWGERTPLWLYAIGIPVLVAVATASTRRSPSGRVLVVAALLASGVIAYAWAALVSKPPELLGMPEASFVTFGALVLLAGLAMRRRETGTRAPVRATIDDTAGDSEPRDDADSPIVRVAASQP